MSVYQTFEGRKINIPDIYIKNEFPSNIGGVSANSNIVCILGEAKGGIPIGATGYEPEDQIMEFSSVTTALDILQGGNAYYMTECFLNPTKDEELAKPSKVYVAVVNNLTQGASSIQSSEPASIISLKSTRFGPLANQICRKVESGTISGYKVTVKKQGVTIAEKDNIALNYLSLQYTGTGTLATVSITNTHLTTAVDNTGELNIVLSNFTTLRELVSYINEQPNYLCTILTRDDTDPSTLDSITTQDIKTLYVAKGNIEALIQFFSNECQGELMAELSANASRNPIANDSNYVFLSGGSETVATSTDWSDAFTLLEKFDINHILVASSNAAYHEMLRTHLDSMSDLMQCKNRSGGTGASLSATKSEIASESRLLNSARTEYWGTPIKRRNVLTGKIETFDPFYGAALGAGVRFGGHITMSATFKTVNILGVGHSYSKEEKEELIESGVSIIGKEKSGFEIIHNISTYQSSNLILTLPSMLRTADYLTLDEKVKLRLYIQKLKKAPTTFIKKSTENYILTKLLPSYVEEGYLTDDPDTETKAFSDVHFTISGDSFSLEYTGIIPAPWHYGFIKQRFVVPGTLS